eukprot:TRINITY_DN22269_c0_g1_i1.p1 TRINITY_DN22269_c0_g1~~TRINITY_DN22269_c0_g1_i1.p1  ORF type:complete len:911 (-),score=203.80 TRINITY_DN22269_c0_g1_i1:154-2886(-)
MPTAAVATSSMDGSSASDFSLHAAFRAGADAFWRFAADAQPAAPGTNVQTPPSDSGGMPNEVYFTAVSQLLANTGARCRQVRLRKEAPASVVFFEAPQLREEQSCVVIYCPAAAASAGVAADWRRDALDIARHLLPVHISLMCLSLGEQSEFATVADDIRQAVESLRCGKVGRPHAMVALWGRGTGADAAMRYASTDPLLAALIADCMVEVSPKETSLGGPLQGWMAAPLRNLMQLAQDATDALPGMASCDGTRQALGRCTATSVSHMEPGALTSPAPRPVGALDAARMDIAVPLQQLAAACFAPAFFISDEELPTARRLQAAYAGEKQLHIVQGAEGEKAGLAGARARGRARAALHVARACSRSSAAEGGGKLKDAMDQLVAIATGKQTSPPRNGYGARNDHCREHAPSAEDHCRAFCAADHGEERRACLLLASLASFPGLRIGHFRRVPLQPWDGSFKAEGVAPTLPPGDAAAVQSRKLLDVSAAVRLPGPDTELVLAWASAASKSQGKRDVASHAGCVLFAVISASLASLTAVRLSVLPGQEASDGEAAVPPAFAPQVDTLAIKQLQLEAGEAEHALQLKVLLHGRLSFAVGGVDVCTDLVLPAPLAAQLSQEASVALSLWGAVSRPRRQGADKALRRQLKPRINFERALGSVEPDDKLQTHQPGSAAAGGAEGVAADRQNVAAEEQEREPEPEEATLAARGGEDTSPAAVGSDAADTEAAEKTLRFAEPQKEKPRRVLFLPIPTAQPTVVSSEHAHESFSGHSPGKTSSRSPGCHSHASSRYSPTATPGARSIITDTFVSHGAFTSLTFSSDSDSEEDDDDDTQDGDALEPPKVRFLSSEATSEESSVRGRVAAFNLGDLNLEDYVYTPDPAYTWPPRQTGTLLDASPTGDKALAATWAAPTKDRL